MPRAAAASGLPNSDPLARSLYANATLTAIATPGSPDRNGDPTTGTPIWTGAAPGYLTRIDRTILNDGQQTTVKLDVFALPRTVGAAILEVAGPDWTATTVTIEDRRNPDAIASFTFRVRAMEQRAAGTALDHIRLELEHGQPA